MYGRIQNNDVSSNDCSPNTVTDSSTPLTPYQLNSPLTAEPVRSGAKIMTTYQKRMRDMRRKI